MAIIIVLLFLLSLFGYIVLSAYFNAFVLSKIWLWFVVPQFAVAPLSVSRAYGLELLMSIFLVGIARSAELREGKKAAGTLISYLLVPWMILLIGWIVKTYFA